MSNSIYIKLLENKIDNLINSFKYTSRSIFYDAENKRIIHPGEFGGYREKILNDFIKIIIPKIYGIGDGFIISNTNQISTQCDIVIYDRDYTPTVEIDSFQKFYTVETVVGIGEVKSVLNKSILKETLQKLSNIKRIKSQVQNPYVLKKKSKDLNAFNPAINLYDNIFSFLVCEKLDFDLNNTNWDEYFETVYENIDLHHRHNAILSIEDGLFLYKGLINRQTTILPYPCITESQILENEFIKKEDDYRIFKLFASAMFDGISHATILYPETTRYIE